MSIKVNQEWLNRSCLYLFGMSIIVLLCFTVASTNIVDAKNRNVSNNDPWNVRISISGGGDEHECMGTLVSLSRIIVDANCVNQIKFIVEEVHHDNSEIEIFDSQGAVKTLAYPREAFATNLLGGVGLISIVDSKNYFEATNYVSPIAVNPELLKGQPIVGGEYDCEIGAGVITYDNNGTPLLSNVVRGAVVDCANPTFANMSSWNVLHRLQRAGLLGARLCVDLQGARNAGMDEPIAGIPDRLASPPRLPR